MLILHWRRGRVGLLEPHFDPRHLGDDGFVPLADQLAEQLEGFGLVLVQRIALRHAAPADHLTQMVECDKMLAPEMVERLQDDLLFDIAHGFGGVALNALRIGVGRRRMEPGRHFLVGDALLLGPFVDRQIEVELVENLILQARGVPGLGIGVVRNVLGDDVVDHAGAHILDRRFRAIPTPSSCAGPRR